MKLTQKIKIYPTERQKEMLWDLSDICRRLYNKCLEVKQLRYNLHKDDDDSPTISKYDLAKKVRELRREKYEDWYKIQSRVAEQVVWRLHSNYKSFFSQLKKWRNNPKYKIKNGKQVPKNRPSPPRYKGWQYFIPITYNRSGFKFINNGKTVILSLGKNHPDYNYHYSNKLLRFDISHYPLKYNGKIKQVEIYRANQYIKRESDFYISVTFEVNTPKFKDNGLYQAFDLGLTEILVGVNLHSKFVSFENRIKPIEEYWMPKINEVNKKISRCLGSKEDQQKSNRWRRLNKKLKKLHQKRKGQIELYLHNLANQVLQNTRANTLIIGDLNFKQMASNDGGTGSSLQNKIEQTMRRRIMSGLGKFCHFLEYKAERLGKRLIKIDEKHTTQKCCKCNKIKKGGDKLGLADRIYICDSCGNHMDRDKNSAVNIMKRFLSKKENGTYEFLSQDRSVAEQSFREEWFVATHSSGICPEANARQTRKKADQLNKMQN